MTQDKSSRGGRVRADRRRASDGEHLKGFYRDYLKVLAFIAIWVLAVVLTVFLIDAPHVDAVWQHPDYHNTLGYTHSLVLLFLPLSFLAFWYIRNRDALDLRPLMGAMLRITAFTALTWILLDVLFANALFWFPDKKAHLQVTLLPGYSWKGELQHHLDALEFS